MNVSALLDRIPGASSDAGYGPVTVDVPVEQWAATAASARADLGCTWFDFLTAVDDPDGPAVVCHLVRPQPLGHVLLRARLDSRSPVVESLAPAYPGAGWHERETAEMFGITFVSDEGQPLAMTPLLLPPGFDGHPLRKEFALQARLDRPWPGAKDPGES